MKMLFLVVAAIILPGMLGCCSPLQYSGYTTSRGPRIELTVYFIVDISQNKSMTRPVYPDQNPTRRRIEYILQDFGTKMGYIKYTDGKCTKSGLRNIGVVNNCYLDDGEDLGTEYLGDDSLKTQSYRFRNGAVETIIHVTADKCLPLFTVGSVLTPTDFKIFTTHTTNVTDDVKDLDDLDQDVSNCT